MAAYVANTDGISGEEGSNCVSTLKEYLCDLPNIYTKLEANGMTELDIFIYINDKDLDILCGKNGINLKFMESVKFKSIIRKIQTKFAPKQMTQIIAITMNEQKELNKIKFAINQTEDVQILF
eukprot:101264_1